MTINERVKFLRKNELKITQAEMAQALGIGRESISYIEHGKNNVSERVKRDICSHFNVRPEWLETGEGEIFKPEKSRAAQRILAAMADMPDDYWEVLEDIIERVAKK